MLEVVNQTCPYCDEPIELVIDCSVLSQEYIEDCQVCCRPMTVISEIVVTGLPQVRLQREDD